MWCPQGLYFPVRCRVVPPGTKVPLTNPHLSLGRSNVLLARPHLASHVRTVESWGSETNSYFPASSLTESGHALQQYQLNRGACTRGSHQPRLVPPGGSHVTSTQTQRPRQPRHHQSHQGLRDGSITVHPCQEESSAPPSQQGSHLTSTWTLYLYQLDGQLYVVNNSWSWNRVSVEREVESDTF